MAGNTRIQIMEQMGQRMRELEELDEDLMQNREDMEERKLIEEDEDYLMNLERYRRKKEKDEKSWEPSLVVCWAIVFIVTVYVIFLIVAGKKENELVKDEL